MYLHITSYNGIYLYIFIFKWMALWPMNVARSLAVSGTRSRASSRKEQDVAGCSREGHSEMFTIQIQQPQSQLKTVSAKISPGHNIFQSAGLAVVGVVACSGMKGWRETLQGNQTHVTPDKFRSKKRSICCLGKERSNMFQWRCKISKPIYPWLGWFKSGM